MARKKKITNKTLIKKEFITAFAEKYSFTFTEAKKRVEPVLEFMAENFKRNNSLIFRNLGSFEVKETKRTQARNPRTGESITVKPKKYVKFKVSKNIYK